MEKTQYLVQKNQGSKVKFHLLTLSGSRITREWGLIGGVVQGVYHDYKPINEGKSNMLTPEMAAEEDFIRIIETKEKEGYVRTVTLTDLPVLPDTIETLDLDNIPTGFCCSKPTKLITDTAIDKLIKSGNARFFVKYNGGCHYILIDSMGEVHIYTRRWDDHTSKYPSVVKAVKAKKPPKSTLMIAELCIDPLLNLDHMTAFNLFASIAKADTLNGACKPDQTESLARQKKHPVKAAIFGYLYYRGHKAWNKPYTEVWDKVVSTIDPLSKGGALFLPQGATFTSGKEAITKTRSVKKKIEGFILWDMTQAMEVTMNGKPLRRACWKIKAKGEMEVIAIGGKEGKVAGKFGSIHIGRYDKTGKLIDMGTVGGLKPKQGETEPTNWKFPCVIEVTFDNVFPDTGLLQFGSFAKVHEERQPNEVDLFSLVQ